MARRRGASRGKSSTPASLWLFTGLFIGLGLSWFLFSKGYFPYTDRPQREQSGPITIDGSEPLVDDLETEEPERDRYDFFTVLPEMEVVVPEQELNVRSQPESVENPAVDGGTQYLLQVGSFRSNDDADQMKARLALLGFVAQVQSVTVNDATWHRVRVGPVSGARAAEDLRGQLTQNGIDSLVLESP
ncbi:MAG TPA: SPOR domain-containing protein [Xanthomonadales bacterium]|nr:SPOR domain-containing protein [Xanthomonadales bacterium]